jgi:hypothetical protein
VHEKQASISSSEPNNLDPFRSAADDGTESASYPAAAGLTVAKREF